MHTDQCKTFHEVYFSVFPEPKDFCQAEYFQPRCGKDEVIVMEIAKYGRMKVNKCVRENFGYIGCGRDVLEHMDMLCSGRRMCNVRVLDDAFESIQPCHDDLKSFLTAGYTCVTGRSREYELLSVSS